MPVPAHPKERCKAIGPNVLAYRLAKRLSQEKVCELAGVSASYLHHVERRGLIPSLPVGIRLAQVLGVRPEAFIVERKEGAEL